MKIESIQVGLPKTIEFRGRSVTTGIFKDPITGPVMVRKLNIDGDKQADLRVHGGEFKAVYAYSVGAYKWWREARPNDTIGFGAFGENLSVDDLPEEKIYIGDTFEVGGAVLQAVQPRYPCYKLGVKFNDPKILRMFMESGRPGVYFRVVREGLINSGDTFKLMAQEAVLVSIAKVFSFFHDSEPSEEDLAQVLTLKSLPPELRRQFEEY